ncbi:MAG: hypothetical protein V4563_17070 [Pseudomonadota bacterium]
MLTCGKDSKNPGKFTYTMYTPDNMEVETVGGFDSFQEADKAASAAHRLLLVGLHPLQAMQIPVMSLDELRAGLEGM